MDTEQNLLERTEMRMLRWMMGIKRIEKIRNEEEGQLPVANISENIREARLRWLGHVERNTEEDKEKMEVGGHRNYDMKTEIEGERYYKKIKTRRRNK